MDFLNQELFAGLTILQVTGLVVGFFVFGSVMTKINAAKSSSKLLKKRCRACKWEGPATAKTTICPKCRGTLHKV